jgi:hypothetical protein
MSQIPPPGMNWMDRVGAERTELGTGPASLARRPIPDVEGLGEHIAAAMNEGVVVRGSSGETVWHNPAVCKLLRTSRDELGGVLDRLHERATDVDGNRITREHSPVTATLRTRLPVRNSIVGIGRDDGDTTWLSISSRPGELAGEFIAIISFTDITLEERRRRELDSAVRQVRESTTQDSLPRTDRLRFAPGRRGRPLTRQGFQGVFEIDPDRYGFYLGNVPTDPTRAACIASLTLHTLRSGASLIEEPDDLLPHLQDMVAAEWPGTTLSTTFGRVDVGHDGVRVHVSCAGAPPPVLLSADGVRSVGIEGPMIGTDRRAAWPAQTAELAPGDRLVASTCGPANVAGAALDLPGLFTALDRDLPIEDLAVAADELVAEVVDDDERDLTVLAIGYD